MHLATGELAAAIPNAPFRWLVGHGRRLDRMAPLNERALNVYRHRHDAIWALGRLDRPPPWLHCQGVVAAVSLLEVWAHHEDVLAATDLGPCRSGVDLAPVISVLVRCQRRILRRHSVRVTSGETVWYEPATGQRALVDGSVDDVARWLAGRGSLAVLEPSGDPDVIAALVSESPRL